MHCRECGTDNRQKAKFCSNCGSRLIPQEKVCPHCRVGNPGEARFCANCGAEFGLRAQPVEPVSIPFRLPLKRRVRIGPRWRPALMALALLGAVTLVVLVAEDFFSPEPPPEQRLVEQKSGDPAVEAKVLEVASKFICACGSCGEQPLDTCRCNAAIQERQFIRGSLQSGQTVEQVIVAVNDNFGWMKPEFAPKYGPLSSRLVAPKQTTPPFGQVASKSVPASTGPATQADRIEIFSHFQCACGQCGIDELKDCNCSHPRGAKEVKAFADEKIGEGKLTVALVIDAIEAKYGGRKR